MDFHSASRPICGPTRHKIPLRPHSSTFTIALVQDLLSRTDALHALSCAAGYNIRWLLRAIARLGPKLVFLRLLMAALTVTARVKSSFASRLPTLARYIVDRLTSSMSATSATLA